MYEKVVSEGADFAATARKESENSEIDVIVGRGERDDAYESNVFALETGAVTEPFLWRGKWYVVKCVNDFDEDATLERKNNMALERKTRRFGAFMIPLRQSIRWKLRAASGTRSL